MRRFLICTCLLQKSIKMLFTKCASSVRMKMSRNIDSTDGYAVGNWWRLVDAFDERIETIHINDLESIIPLNLAVWARGLFLRSIFYKKSGNMISEGLFVFGKQVCKIEKELKQLIKIRSKYLNGFSGKALK